MTLNDEGKDKKEDYRRQPWSTYALLAMVVILGGGAIVEAGLTRPLRLYVDDNGAVAATYNVSTAVTNVSFWGINFDYPRCEFQIGQGLCINGSNTTNQGVWINGSALSGGGGGLTSVPVINITGVNVTNGTTHTLTLRKDDGTTLSVTFDDTNTGGGGAFNISNRDTWLNVTNSTGVINWNVSNGYPLTNQTAATCNPVTEYSVWNGTHFICDADGSGTDTNNYTTSLTIVGNVVTLGRTGMTDLVAYLLNNSITLDAGNITAGQLVDARIASAAAWNHAGSSNYTGLVTLPFANLTEVPGFGYSNLTFVNVTNGSIVTNNTAGFSLGVNAGAYIQVNQSGNTITVGLNQSIPTAGSGGGNASSNGTSNYVAKFNGVTTTLANSIIQDNGSSVGIGTVPNGNALTVSGNGNFTGALCVGGRCWRELGGVIHQSYSVTNGLAANVSTGEQYFQATNVTLPANFFSANKTLKIYARFNITTTAGAPTVTWRLRISNSTTAASILAAGNPGAANSYNNVGVNICFMVTAINTTHLKGGSCIMSGDSINYGRFDATWTPVAWSFSSRLNPIVTFQWGSSVAGNSLTFQDVLYEQLGLI